MTSEPIPEILYQDDDLIVVNKPPGLTSESPDSKAESLLGRMSDHFGRQLILYHRLDRMTSGCILFGRTARFNRAIAGLFSEKKIRKEYWAVVEGSWPKGLNRVETRIAPLDGGRWENREDSGKPAVTTFRRLSSAEGRTWLQVLPKTGRTHQIRLHCVHAGCPVVGDALYGPPGTKGSLLLHARKLTFRHPADARTIEVEAPLPDYWDEWIRLQTTVPRPR
ncbi:MAG: RNA pseudouridine synthase [Verrucomicrobia bacterium]|nr:MAG: RNA pseudouridine synthase [Verrucomicrobiota bacterium]